MTLSVRFNENQYNALLRLCKIEGPAWNDIRRAIESALDVRDAAKRARKPRGTAEKDIRSALRQLRGCRGRLAMARTSPLTLTESMLLDDARARTGRAERWLVRLLALLGAEGAKR